MNYPTDYDSQLLDGLIRRLGFYGVILELARKARFQAEGGHLYLWPIADGLSGLAFILSGKARRKL